MNDYNVLRSVGQIEMVDVPFPERDVLETSFVEPSPSHIEHFMAEVYAESVADPRGEDFENSARTGSNIQKIPDHLPLYGVEHGRLNDLVLHMPGAEPIPVLGDVLEVSGGNGGPLVTYRRQTVKISGDGFVVGVDHGDDGVEHLPAKPGTSGLVESVTAFGVTLQHPGVAKQLQVPTHPGLALAQYPTEFRNREFITREHSNDTKPGLFGCGSKCGEKLFHGVPYWCGARRSIPQSVIRSEYKDILMY